MGKDLIKVETNKSMCHFWIGTSGLLNVHTRSMILLNDKICIGNLNLLVIDIILTQKSRIHKDLNFYELRYETIS